MTQFFHWEGEKMSEPQQQNPDHNRDRAFEIVEIDAAKNTMLIEVHRGIAGALANQLKACPDERKGARIIRKLGFEAAKASGQAAGIEAGMEAQKAFMQGQIDSSMQSRLAEARALWEAEQEGR